MDSWVGAFSIVLYLSRTFLTFQLFLCFFEKFNTVRSPNLSTDRVRVVAYHTVPFSARDRLGRPHSVLPSTVILFKKARTLPRIKCSPFCRLNANFSYMREPYREVIVCSIIHKNALQYRHIKYVLANRVFGL